MSTTVFDNIAMLVTNDPALGAGQLGIVRDASLVTDGAKVLAVGRRGLLADERVDVEGRAVIPGFVDSHSHLVFAGDRSEEFAARMAGAPYAAGGIRDTVAATAATDDAELLRIVGARRAEAHRAGITTIEIKSGYGLTPAAEARALRLARHFTADTTFLGAHVVPAEFTGRADDYVALVCGEMLAAAVGDARFVDVFCEIGAFDADQSRAVLQAGMAAGLIPKIHANQLGQGPGVALAVSWAALRQITARTSATPTWSCSPAVTRWRRCCPPRTSRRASRIPTRGVCSMQVSPWRWPRTATRAPATPRR